MVNYYLILTKPGILLGNLVTVAAGFWLAAKGHLDLALFAATMTGLLLIMASGCIYNNYIDRHIDEKMERTKERPFVKGVVSTPIALCLAFLLLLAGNALLFIWTNPLTVAIADMGFFIYVLLYSFWKSKTRFGTAIGSLAGAVPPLVGYCAVSNRLDAGGIILFVMMVLWQMPHFFAIALYRMNDYKKAGLPVLPLVKGIWRTKIQMTIYIVAFMVAAALLTFYGYTGSLYLFIASTLGFMWLCLCLKGFWTDEDQQWGKQMFRLSLVLIALISLSIPLDFL